MTTTNDLPEFNVSVKMARRHADGQNEHRTFTARVPAVDLQHAEAAAYGLGHGINDASRYTWKFADTDPNVSAEPATDTTEIEQLRAELASARAAGDALYKATHAAFQHICLDLDENNPRVSDFFANALTAYRTATEKTEAAAR